MAADNRGRSARDRGNQGRPKSHDADKRRAGRARPDTIEEVADRAARLGITVERVLNEYARIAFADLRHFIEKGANGPILKDITALNSEDVAAVREFAPGADAEHSRLKFYDKKAALDAIARHLGMFPAAPRRRDEALPADDGEDAREVLARLLDRLAAGRAAP